jgi:hypothetical protein
MGCAHFLVQNAESQLAYKIGGKFILLGDGACQGKEGGKMPGAAVLRQDSGDSLKPEFMRGHMFGCIGLAVASQLKLFSVPIIMEIHSKISGMIRKFTAGSNPLDMYNAGRCYEASAVVPDEFIHNKNNGAGIEGNKGNKGEKVGKAEKAEKSEKAGAGNETACIARIAADAGILAASMGIGRYLEFERHFMFETSFLISERECSGLAGTATRAKLGCAAFESPFERTGLEKRGQCRACRHFLSSGAL